MRYVFALMGSRGDVQPALPVALELRRRGHDVTVTVPPNLVDLVARLGLEPVVAGPDSHAVLTSDAVAHDMRSADPVRRWRGLKAVATAGWDEFRDGVDAVAEGADMIVTGLLGQEVGSAIAESRGAEFAAIHYCPVRANDEVPLVPRVRSVGIQRAAWHAGERLRWALTRQAENEARESLGLRAATVDLPQRLRDRGALEIQAWDPMLVPDLPSEWGPRRPFTGFLALAPEDRAKLGEGGVDDDLTAWLDAGDPPIYVGFGSMPVRDPQALLDTVRSVCRTLGARALVSSGDLPADSGEAVRVTGPIDHVAVLPRCAVAVHHGGAGTTAATLRAGVPSVVGWFSADQPIWGALLRERRLGTSLRFTAINHDSLVAAIGEALAPDVRQRVRRVADSLITPAEAVARTADALELRGTPEPAGHAHHHRA